jgi:transposase InsO family protein
VKFAAIADWADSDEFPVDFMCRELGVSRSGYYAWRGRTPSEREQADTALLAIIKGAYQRLRGNPGVRRIHAELRVRGHRLSRKRVWRLMQDADLQGRHPKAGKRTTVAGESPVPAPDLIGRDFTAQAANQRWCGDITYIKTWDGWAYLYVLWNTSEANYSLQNKDSVDCDAGAFHRIATVIDCYSKAVVGWAVADHMRTELVTDAINMAARNIRIPKNAIFHSDLGSNTCRTSIVKRCKSTASDPPSGVPVFAGTTHSPNHSTRA